MSKQAQALIKNVEKQFDEAKKIGSCSLALARTVTALCDYIFAATVAKKKQQNKKAGDKPVVDKRNVMPTEASAWRILAEALTLAPGVEELLDMPKATGLVIPLCVLFDNIRVTFQNRSEEPAIVIIDDEPQDTDKLKPLTSDEELTAVIANARSVLEVASWRRRFFFHPTPEWSVKLAASTVSLANCCPECAMRDAAECARYALDVFTAVSLAHADSSLLFEITLNELLVPLLSAVSETAKNTFLAPVCVVALHGLIVLPVCSALAGSCFNKSSSSSSSTLDEKPEAYPAKSEPGSLLRALQNIVTSNPNDAVLSGVAFLYKEIIRTVDSDSALNTAALSSTGEPANKRSRGGEGNATTSVSDAVSSAASSYVRSRSAQELRSIKSRFFLNYASVFLSVVIPSATTSEEKTKKEDMRMLKVVGEILEITSDDGFLGMVTTQFEGKFFASAAEIAVHHILDSMNDDSYKKNAIIAQEDIYSPALVVTQLLRLDHTSVEDKIRQILVALWRYKWKVDGEKPSPPPPFTSFWHHLVAVYRELRQLDTAFVDLLLNAMDDMMKQHDCDFGPYFMTYDSIVQISDGFAQLLHQQALPVLERFSKFWYSTFSESLSCSNNSLTKLHTRFCSLWTSLIASAQLSNAAPFTVTKFIDQIADDIKELIQKKSQINPCCFCDLVSVLSALINLRISLLRTTGNAAYADKLLLTVDECSSFISVASSLGKSAADWEKSRLLYSKLEISLTTCNQFGENVEDDSKALLSRVLRHCVGKDVVTGEELDEWSRTVLPPPQSLQRSALFFKYATWQLIAQNMPMVMLCSTDEQRSNLLGSIVHGFLAVDGTSIFSRALFACATFYQIPFVFENVIRILFEQTESLLSTVVDHCDSDFVFANGREDNELKAAFGENSSLAIRVVLRFLSACHRMADPFFPKGIIYDICSFFIPVTKMFSSLGDEGKKPADGLFDLLCRIVAIDSKSLRSLKTEEVAFLLNESFSRHEYKLLSIWARGYFEKKEAYNEEENTVTVTSSQLLKTAKSRGVAKAELFGYLMIGINEECHQLELVRKNVKGCSRIVLPEPITSFVESATTLLLKEWKKHQGDCPGVVVLASELLRFFTRVEKSVYDAESVRDVRSNGADSCVDRFHSIESAVMKAAISRLHSDVTAPIEATSVGVSEQQERLAALQFITTEIGQQMDLKQKNKKPKDEEGMDDDSYEEFQKLVDLVMSVASNAHYNESGNETEAVRKLMYRLLKIAKTEQQRDILITTSAKGLASHAKGVNNAATLLLDTVLKSNCFVHHDILQSLFGIVTNSILQCQQPKELETSLRCMTTLALFTMEHVAALSSQALTMACSVIRGLVNSPIMGPSVFVELTRSLHMLIPNEDICGSELNNTLQLLTTRACFEPDQQKAVFYGSCVSRIMEDLSSHDKKGWAFLYAHHVIQNYLNQIDHAGGRGKLDSICQAFHPGICALLSICNDEQVRRVHYLATAASKSYFQEIRDMYQREYQYKGKA